MKQQRYISLPAANKSVRLGVYVSGIKKAISMPDATFPYGLTTWWPTKGREIRQQFRRGIHDRINQGIKYSERGLA